MHGGVVRREAQRAVEIAVDRVFRARQLDLLLARGQPRHRQQGAGVVRPGAQCVVEVAAPGAGAGAFEPILGLFAEVDAFDDLEVGR
jgi:hypothetical protein